MRIIYLAFVIIFAGVLAIFAIENAASVAVALFGWQVVAPLSAVIVAVYLLGMATGGSVVSFIRHSLHRATQPSARGGRAPPAKS